MAVTKPRPPRSTGSGGVGWAYESPGFAALEHRFRIRSDDVELGSGVAELLGALASPEEPTEWYSVLNRYAVGGPCAVYFGSERLALAADPGEAVSWLLHHLNRQAIETCTSELVVHAAAAEHEGRALLLPGPPGSGKSTLVAALVRAGLRYLTDEAAALDLDSLEVRPYPKPICLKPGSQPALPDLEPLPGLGSSPHGGDWWVPVTFIRPDSLAVASRPAFVIAPRYQRGAATTLAPMRAAEAVMFLAECSFNLADHGGAGLKALAGVVRSCACYNLAIGDLDAACELITGLLGSSGPGVAQPGTVVGSPADF